MRILHVVRGLANSSGTTHIVVPLAEAQARLGHAVEVMCIEKRGEQALRPDASLVACHEFPMTIPSVHFGWSRAFGRAIKDAVRRSDIVHIHAIWNYATWMAMRAAAQVGVPYVVAPQGSLSEWALARSRRLKSLYASLLEKPLFDRAAAMHAVSPVEAEECRRFGISSPVVVIPNGVNHDIVVSDRQEGDLRAELGLADDSVMFVFVGRLFPKKGLDLLIPAFGQLASTNPKVQLLIAGHDGGSGYRSSVEAMAAATGQSERIHFLGELRGQRKFDVLRGADVFVLSSYSEGLPVAVLEALACGLPVVITPDCNLPLVFEREAGWKVDKNVDSVAAGLHQASLDDRERKRHGQNGRRLVMENFTWDTIAEKCVAHYGRLQGVGVECRSS